MTVYKWSQTAASDATADPSINWQEGQAPSTVNDSGRAMMAATAKYRDDIGGTLQTGGTSTAYTISSNQVFTSLATMDHAQLTILMHATNGSSPTLNVDGLGAVNITLDGTNPVPVGVLVAGSPYTLTYYASGSTWRVRDFHQIPYAVPIGGVIDYFGTTAPNANWVFPAGQAISRTTYATLFALVGTTYGTGDGSTTFNLPDLRGRVRASLDNMGGSAASRITSATASPDGNTMGATAGGQVVTLVTANLPPYTPAGSVATTVTPSQQVLQNVGGNSTNAPGSLQFVQTNASVTTFPASSTFTGTAQGGTSTPVNNMPPAILCTCIMRVI